MAVQKTITKASGVVVTNAYCRVVNVQSHAARGKISYSVAVFASAQAAADGVPADCMMPGGFFARGTGDDYAQCYADLKAKPSWSGATDC